VVTNQYVLFLIKTLKDVIKMDISYQSSRKNDLWEKKTSYLIKVIYHPDGRIEKIFDEFTIPNSYF